MNRWWLRNRAVVAMVGFVLAVVVFMVWNRIDVRGDVAHACAWADSESCR